MKTKKHLTVLFCCSITLFLLSCEPDNSVKMKWENLDGELYVHQEMCSTKTSLVYQELNTIYEIASLSSDRKTFTYLLMNKPFGMSFRSVILVRNGSVEDSGGEKTGAWFLKSNKIYISIHVTPEQYYSHDLYNFIGSKEVLY